ncbi:MAG TPA: nucleoside hydrolase [Candidatus Acidoferrales bacterium]|nr:nucleoside hydrolase [Candidatus Acidoferrales bacterium]
MGECLRVRSIVAIAALGLLVLLAAIALHVSAAAAKARATQTIYVGLQHVIIDTDIGDDIDDAFAVSLALNSPDLKIDGITTAWGDTHLRARLVNRLLAQAGRSEIPVAEGIATHSKAHFTQARWAEGGAEPKQHVDAVDFLLRQIAAHPGDITLITIAPLTNIAAAIDRDPATFRKVRRIVMMGGSIYRGYLDPGAGPNPPPDPEYNIASDVAAAQKVLQSGAQIYMLPLDATQIRLDEVRRGELFATGTPITDALTLLYHQWGQPTPVLYDPVAVSYAIQPNLCTMKFLRIDVDKDGYTRVGQGSPNVMACLASDREKVLDFILPRLMASPKPAS